MPKIYHEVLQRTILFLASKQLLDSTSFFEEGNSFQNLKV